MGVSGALRGGSHVVPLLRASTADGAGSVPAGSALSRKLDTVVVVVARMPRTSERPTRPEESWERRPSFVERGRGAARRSAGQSARIRRNLFFAFFVTRVRYRTPPIFVSRQAFGLDDKRTNPWQVFLKTW